MTHRLPASKCRTAKITFSMCYLMNNWENWRSLPQRSETWVVAIFEEGTHVEMAKLCLLAAQPDDLSLIPVIHMVEEDHCFQQVFSWPPHVLFLTHTHAHTQTNKSKFENFKLKNFFLNVEELSWGELDYSYNMSIRVGCGSRGPESKHPAGWDRRPSVTLNPACSI